MRKQALHPRTAGINSKQKSKSKQAKYEALHWLAEQFPQAFDTRECIRPLKTGIIEDILAYAEQAAIAGVSKSKLREAVVIFTRRMDYLACLKAQETRIDLQGNSTAAVTAEEAEKAALKIKKRIEKSIKNARKACHSTKSHAPYVSKSNTPSKPLPPHQYPEPAVYTSMAAPKRAVPSITVKSSRAYDPHAVARLKEKLGLSKKEEMVED